MMARTHLAFGLFAGTSLFVVASNMNLLQDNSKTIFLFLVGTALGSLIPDIDEPHSFIGRKFLFLSYPINIIFKHRMFTHSLLFVLILSLFLSFLNMLFYNPPFYIGITIGVIAHIVGDMHTKGGCPIFLPVSTKKLRIFPVFLAFRTGSFVEYIFTILYMGLFLFILKYILVF